MKKLWIAVLVVLTPLGLLAQAAAPETAKPAAKTKAIIETTAGNLTCTLFPDKAPKGVANFIGLAKGTKSWVDPKSSQRKRGVPLYDGTIFHRVFPEFMIQGGDPAGTGSGEVGINFGVEASKDLNFDRGGRLAYANTGQPNSNGSQFFITEVPYPSLNGKYTIFGQCDAASVQLVKKIARMPANSDGFPKNPVTIKHVTIEGDTDAAKPAGQ
jgi:peptidyl-prolyl cis-trans isomerase A (cyclophilin A)